MDAFERNVYLSNCPVLPDKIIKGIRKDAAGTGYYFVFHCDSACCQFEDCIWKKPIFLVDEKGIQEQTIEELK